LRHKKALLKAGSPLSKFKNVEVRVVMRATQFYATLLIESCHPKYLYSKKEHTGFYFE